MLIRNWSVKMPELATSWCSMVQSVRINAFVDHGDFPWLLAIHWSHNFQRTMAVWYTVPWPPFTTICICQHWMECSFLLSLHTLLRTVFKCGFWVIYLVAISAVLRWTTWCLHSCCVPMSDLFKLAPPNGLDFTPLSTGRGGCVSMICWYGIGEEYNK
jgi:hypothetical protein